MDFTIHCFYDWVSAVKMLSRLSLIIADTNSLKLPHAGEESSGDTNEIVQIK